MFFKRKDLGRVYVIRMLLLDGTVVHKVGMTHSDRATDRFFEILRSWFNTFRYVPASRLRLDHECENPEAIEKFMHKVLKEYKYSPGKPVQGHTEMFAGVDEVRLIHFLSNTDKAIKGVSDNHYKILGKLLAG